MCRAALRPFTDIPGAIDLGLLWRSCRCWCSAAGCTTTRGIPGTGSPPQSSLMAVWGVKILILTNAAGGIHDRLGPGDLMVLCDHLLSADAQALGQDCNPALRTLAVLAAAHRVNSGRRARAANYWRACTPPSPGRATKPRPRSGPCERWGPTRSACPPPSRPRRPSRSGLEVAAISCITNKAAGLTSGTLDHAEVLANAAKPAERISDLLETILPRLG